MENEIEKFCPFNKMNPCYKECALYDRYTENCSLNTESRYDEIKFILEDEETWQTLLTGIAALLDDLADREEG